MGKKKSEKKMVLHQRTFHLRKDDIIALDAIRNTTLRENDVENVDLSAALRGIITYCIEIIDNQQSRTTEWYDLMEAVLAAINPTKRGRPRD